MDVAKARILAFTITNNGSRRIERSQVLPSLAISVLEEALQKARNREQSQLGAWLMQQFQSLST